MPNSPAESQLASDRQLLSETEVFCGYGLSLAWLRRARLERRGPRYIKIRRMVRYRRRDIEGYLDEHAVETSERS